MCFAAVIAVGIVRWATRGPPYNPSGLHTGYAKRCVGEGLCPSHSLYDGNFVKRRAG